MSLKPEETEILDGLLDILHKEINEARKQENYAETMVSIKYWRGYREGIERVLAIILKILK